jgi:hypothetical protein
MHVLTLRYVPCANGGTISLEATSHHPTLRVGIPRKMHLLSRLIVTEEDEGEVTQSSAPRTIQKAFSLCRALLKSYHHEIIM